MSKNKHHKNKQHKPNHTHEDSAVKANTESPEALAVTSMPAESNSYNPDSYESNTMSSELGKSYQSTGQAGGNEWGYSATRQKEPFSSSPSGLAEDPFEQDAEFATEVAYPPVIGADPDARYERRNESAEGGDRADAGEGRAIGWFGLVLAVISLFIWPAVFGTIAAIIGVVAYVRGSKGLGAWTIGIGLVSLLAYFFLVPYYA